MSKGPTLDLINPILEALHKCTLSAWQQYLKFAGDRRHRITPRTRASLVHDFFFDAAELSLAAIKGVKFLDLNGLRLISFRDVLIRFKKLNDRNQGSNIHTGQAELFQTQQLCLPGMPAASNLTLGYHPDKLGEQVSSVILAQAAYGRNLWEHVFSDLKAEVIAFPSPKDDRKMSKPRNARPRRGMGKSTQDKSTSESEGKD